MEESTIWKKSYAFAIRTVNAYKYLAEVKKEYVLSKQMLRSGTAIGALVAEAVHAQSTPDFLSKMSIALKEANETLYWISLLRDTGYLDENSYVSIYSDCNELVAMLVSIVKSIRKNMQKNL